MNVSLSDKGASQTVCANHAVDAVHRLSFWESGIRVYAAECVCHPTPIKTWAPRFRCVSLVDSTSHVLLQLVAAGIKHVPCDPQRETLASSAWFPLDLTPCTLPFADFALRPLAVINLSREHVYIQSPVSPGESPIPGVVLGTPDTGSFASQQAWGLHA